MTPERWRQVTGVFTAALAHEPAARAAFLCDACGADAALRAEIEALLAAHEEAAGFGDDPLPLSQDALREWAADADVLTTDGQSIGAVPRAPAGPFVWTVRIASALAAAAVGSVAWLLVTSGPDAPAVGWTEARRGGVWRIAAVDPQGPASGRVRAGDRILTVNGHPVAGPQGSVFHRQRLPLQGTYRLEVDRDGERHTLVLPTTPDPNAAVRALTTFVIGAIWCAVGAFIGFARPQRAVARLACAAALVTGVAYLGGVVRMGPAGQPLHIVLGYHFFYRFPNDHTPGGAWRWLLRGLYACAIPAAVHGLYMQFTLQTQGVAGAAALITGYPRLHAVKAMMVPLIYGGAIAGMVAVLVRNYRRLTDDDSRRRIRWVSAASLVAMGSQFGWVAVDLFNAFIGPAPVNVFAPVTDAVTVLIPISVAYAVVRHRVFDITVVLRRSAQYVLARRALQVMAAVPIAALLFTTVMNRDRTIAELTRENSSYLYWIAAAAVVLGFRHTLQSWLDRRFFREACDRERILLTLPDDLSKAESVSELSRLIGTQLDAALHPRSVHLWHQERDTLVLADPPHAIAAAPVLTPSPALAAWLEAHPEPHELPLPSDARLSDGESRRLAMLGAQLIVPFTSSRDRLAGVLMLGGKKSDEPYSANDRRLLHAITRQAAMVMENLGLKALVSQEQRIRQDVLARLDGDGLGILKQCPACGECYDGPLECCPRDGERLTLPLPVTRTLDERYRLDRLIATGGMGAVYEGRDLRLGRVVAVKIILSRAFGDAASLRRFDREARAAARLNHPSIVSVHDCGRLPAGGAYLVMERLQGTTLRAELERRRRLPPDEAADWFEPLLEGLAAAHAEGIVHRDLKPENVMGCRDPSGMLWVKILDFGLAKLHAAAGAPETGTLTIEGAAMGTVGYMAPEQVRGNDVDQRADVFTAGVMLVEALTGTRPFGGATYGEVAHAVLESTPHLPRSTCLERALDDIVQRCLAKNRSDRFPSSNALRDALIPVLRRTPRGVSEIRAPAGH